MKKPEDDGSLDCAIEELGFWMRMRAIAVQQQDIPLSHKRHVRCERWTEEVTIRTLKMERKAA